MQAVVQEGFGGTEVLSVRDLPDPEPGAGEVLVRVEACALNLLDVLQRRGPGLLPGFALPHLAGSDVAGTVVARGPGVEPEAPGEGTRVVVNPSFPCWSCAACTSGEDGYCGRVEVLGGNRAGGYAEYVVVPARHAHPVPDHVPLTEAAAVPTAWATAWHALITVGRVRIGDTVLIQGAASGVSTAAIQLAKRAGASVVAVASNEDKLLLAKELGADHGVLSTENVVAAVRGITKGRGVDLALDHVGPATWDASIYSLAPKGRLVFLGNTTGNEAAVPLAYAYHLGLQLLGSGGYSEREFTQVLHLYWQGGLRTPVDSEFPLVQAAAAHRRLEERRALGKVLLIPARRP